jgi:radical SAM superfamily enzyme YgiQ (UPF0313 family)
MRVLLIQSYLGRCEPPVAPLGLASLAANMPGHQVRIFDPNIARNPIPDTQGAIEDFQPEVIGLSLRNIDTTRHSNQFLYFAHFHPFVKTIKKACSSATIIIGGGAFSLFPEQILQSMPEIDFGLHLEAERTLPLFLDRGARIEDIPGLYFRADGVLRYTRRPDPVSLDELEPPAWDLLDMEAYRPFTSQASIGIEGKRGCSLKCAYCTYPTLSGSRIRLKSPSRVVQELLTLKEKFCDCVFNNPMEHARSVCREFLDKGVNIRWSAYHQDSNLTPEYIALVREAGCDEFYLSPDSATARGLKILNKATTVQSLHRSLDLLAEDGQVKAAYNFFTAVPGLGLLNLLAAVRFLIKARLRLGKRLNRYHFSYIRVEPGTPLAEVIANEKQGQELVLLPRNEREMDRLFYRRSSSFLLNILLEIHYRMGKWFGKKNVLK